MLVLDAAATAAALPYPALIAQLRSLFSGGMRAPDRHHHTLPVAAGADATLLLMPAWDERIGCVKIVTVTPSNSTRKLPAVAGSVLVFERETGTHVALVDGSVLTARRTAAASALAASFLARQDASTLLVIGAGRVAAQLPEAFLAVRPIRQIWIWDRTPEAARVLASALCARGLNASAVDELEKSVPQADIVSAATLASEPLLKGEWLRPGQHVDLIGAFTPTMREADDTALRRARIFVDTPFAALEAGELKIPLASGVLSQSDILGDLHDLSAGLAGRLSLDEITLFKSVGNAVMDLAAAIVATRGHTV